MATPPTPPTSAAPRTGRASERRGPPQLRPDRHHHFLGIGGIGMSALAAVLHRRGVPVSGSDTQGGPALDALAAAGIPVSVGHTAAALAPADAVVYSSAVGAGQPIWAEVTRRGLPRIHRAELLGALAAERRTLAVTGTHGKTTCTAALAEALRVAGWQPQAIVGGHVPQWEGRNYLLDSGPWLVCEADESDGSFIHMAPEGLLLTNVEEDHLDHHGTLAALSDAFRTFLGQIQPDGWLVYCADDPLAARLAAEHDGRRRSYGLHAAADVTVRIAGMDADGMRLAFTDEGGAHSLQVPLLGEHNALNLCGVYALASALGAPAEPVLAGLAGFRGVARRQQYLGRVGGLALYDDYAHHPTEVRATLAGFRATRDVPLTVVFQPHLYSRTAHFADAFADALRPAHRVYVTEVYGAREQPVPGVSGRMIVDRMQGHPAAQYLADWRELPARVRSGEVPDGLLISVGAGDVTGLGPLLLRELA